MKYDRYMYNVWQRVVNGTVRYIISDTVDETKRPLPLVRLLFKRN